MKKTYRNKRRVASPCPPPKKTQRQSYKDQFKLFIPKNAETLGEKLKCLSKKAREPYMELEETSAEKAVRLGRILLAAKEIVRNWKGPKRRWADYLDEHFDFVRRTAQLYMQLAVKVDPDLGL